MGQSANTERLTREPVAALRLKLNYRGIVGIIPDISPRLTTAEKGHEVEP